MKESLIDKTDTTIGHWKGKKVTIQTITPTQTTIADDVVIKAPLLNVELKPHALPVIVPQV